ncbi:MAG: M20 family metallopeptidase [Bacillota bacterium]|nr:M20 family metallopeptidase [Bacillota bacterium]
MKEKIVELTQNLEQELKELSIKIYENPELGYQEHKSSKLHIDLLKKYGFEVEENYKNIETGFRAEYDSKKEGPTVAFLVEYDALPGIGHGCGHNILGATSTGASIVLKQIIDEIGGKVVAFGTPAEETSGAKVVFVDEGAFDDVDFAMMAHPNYAYNRSGKSLALEPIEFEFTGKTSHAAAAPEKGINALDAVINTFNAINALRQQTRSDARMHGVITNGGDAANIIPDKAVAQFYVRAQTKTYLDELVERVKNCAKGAALGAGVEIKISNYELSYDNLVTNHTMDDLFVEKLIELGVASEDIKDPREGYGSVDAGNVSHVCPTIHPYFDITNDVNVAPHTREFASCTLTDFAYENMKITIGALALTAAEILKDKDLMKSIKEEFEKAEK